MLKKIKVITKVHLNRYNEIDVVYLKEEVIVSEKTAPLLIEFIEENGIEKVKEFVKNAKELDKKDKEILLKELNTVFFKDIKILKKGVNFNKKIKYALDNLVDKIIDYIEENQKETEFNYDYTEGIYDEEESKVYTLLKVL